MDLNVETDSEDELPHGWEERTTPEGWVYYANHLSKNTVWEHPKTKKRRRVPSKMPYGWKRKEDEQGRFYFLDSINGRKTYTDPRLAFCEDVDIATREMFKQRFDGSSTADQVLLGSDLTGKFVVITGANSGIGFETAKSLAKHGANIVLACRNLKKAEAAIEQISKDRVDVKVIAMQLDLASLKSIKQFAKDYVSKGWPLHVLMMNAAVGMRPWKMTEDNIEETFAVNHVGHFYLTQQLSSLLIRSAPARVVVVSSESHRFPVCSDPIQLEYLSPHYSKCWPMIQYNRSKLCNILFCNELDRRLGKRGVTCNSLHPGNMVYTALPNSSYGLKLLYMIARPFTKSMQQAAACSVYLATAPELSNCGGMYFNNCCQCDPSPLAADRMAAKRLWKLTEDLILDRTEHWCNNKLLLESLYTPEVDDKKCE